MTPTSAPGSRLTALDGLRGMAALMVFVNHARLPGLEPVTIGMDAGVLVFFALSGYLLYRPFLHGPVDLRAYFIRRVTRIYPAYLVAAVGIAVVSGWSWYLQDPIALLLMSSTPIVVAWTLQLELAFYVAVPLIARVIRSPAGVLALAGASMGWATVTIQAVTSTGAAPTTAHLANLPSWLWAFAPGMLVAALERQHPSALRKRWLPAAGLGLVIVGIAWNPEYGNAAAAVGSGCLVAWLITLDLRGKVARVCVVAGALSYPIYLWHQAILDGFGLHLSWPGVAVGLLVTLAVAAVSYRFVEAPAMRFGRHLEHAVRRVGLAPPLRPDPVPVRVDA